MRNETLKQSILNVAGGWFQSLGQPRVVEKQNGPRLLVFPSNSRASGSGHLRGTLIGETLQSRGWQVHVEPSTSDWAARQRVMARVQPDVILMQKSTHPLNRPRLYSPTPVVFDIDDADHLHAERREGVIECCRESNAVVTGSRVLAESLSPYSSSTNVIWTGTPVPKCRPVSPSLLRRPILAWSASGISKSKNDPEFEMAREIVVRLARKCSFEFHLYGVRRRRRFRDFFKPIQQAGIKTKSYGWLSYPRYVRLLRRAAVGMQIISPENGSSQAKSFGKILAYLAADVAVVCSNTGENPRFFRHGQNGMLATAIDEWVESLHELLTFASYRQRVVDEAAEDFRYHLSTRTATNQVEKVLCRVMDEHRMAAHSKRKSAA